MFIEDEDIEVKKPTEPQVSSIKTYTIDLPSMGKHGYPATVEYRDILVKDEKLLAMATEHTFTSTINRVLKSLIIGSDKWFNRMSIADRDFLLLILWSQAYNQRREVGITCGTCGHVMEIEVDLADTPFSTIKDDYEEPFILPLSNGTELGLRMITVGDELAVERLKKADDGFALICSAIQTIDGKVLPLEKKIKWVEENVTGRDMANIRAFFKHFKYGIEPHKRECERCGGGISFEVPIDSTFFLPVTDNNFEEILRNRKKSKRRGDAD